MRAMARDRIPQEYSYRTRATAESRVTYSTKRIVRAELDLLSLAMGFIRKYLIRLRGEVPECSCFIKSNAL